MTTLYTHPDTIRNGPGSELRVAGPAWIQNLAEQVQPLIAAPPKLLTINMGGINFATLFDWITFTSIMERLLSGPMVNSIGFDFASDPNRVLLSRQEWFQYREGTSNRRMVRRQDFDYTTRLYEIVGYLEVNPTELRVTLAPQSSPHRTRAIAALCQELNQTNTCFPGSPVRLHYAIRENR